MKMCITCEKTKSEKNFKKGENSKGQTGYTDECIQCFNSVNEMWDFRGCGVEDMEMETPLEDYHE